MVYGIAVLERMVVVGNLRDENSRLLILEVARYDNIKGEQRFNRRGCGGSRVGMFFAEDSPWTGISESWSRVQLSRL